MVTQMEPICNASRPLLPQKEHFLPGLQEPEAGKQGFLPTASLCKRTNLLSPQSDGEAVGQGGEGGLVPPVNPEGRRPGPQWFPEMSHTQLLLPDNHQATSFPERPLPAKTYKLKEKGHEDDLFGSQILRGQQN